MYIYCVTTCTFVLRHYLYIYTCTFILRHYYTSANKHRRGEDKNLSWASRRDLLDKYSQDIVFVLFLCGHRWGMFKGVYKYDVIFDHILSSSKDHV